MSLGLKINLGLTGYIYQVADACSDYYAIWLMTCRLLFLSQNLFWVYAFVNLSTGIFLKECFGQFKRGDLPFIL